MEYGHDVTERLTSNSFLMDGWKVKLIFVSYQTNVFVTVCLQCKPDEWLDVDTLKGSPIIQFWPENMPQYMQLL